MSMINIASVSMFRPPHEGDTIELDGPAGAELWTVYNGGFGWGLRDKKGDLHPTIKGIDSMLGFITALINHAKGYQ